MEEALPEVPLRYNLQKETATGDGKRLNQALIMRPPSPLTMSSFGCASHLDDEFILLRVPPAYHQVVLTADEPVEFLEPVRLAHHRGACRLTAHLQRREEADSVCGQGHCPPAQGVLHGEGPQRGLPADCAPAGGGGGGRRRGVKSRHGHCAPQWGPPADCAPAGGEEGGGREGGGRGGQIQYGDRDRAHLHKGVVRGGGGGGQRVAVEGGEGRGERAAAGMCRAGTGTGQNSPRRGDSAYLQKWWCGGETKNAQGTTLGSRGLLCESTFRS